MMRLLVGATFVAFVAADVSHLSGVNKYARTYSAEPEVPILRYESDSSPDGLYEYAFEAGNGIAVQQKGYQKTHNTESGTAAEGSYQYTAPDGQKIAVQYIADENGYQPQSDVLPTAPPLPLAILKSLEYNAAHPETESAQSARFPTRFRRASYYY